MYIILYADDSHRYDDMRRQYWRIHLESIWKKKIEASTALTSDQLLALSIISAIYGVK